MSGDTYIMRVMKPRPWNTEEEQRIRECLAYDPKSGEVTWRKRRARCVKVGAVAGGLRKDGYRCIMLSGRNLLAHRAAWFLSYGEWPECVDHVNGIRTDNRLANLRACTKRQNCWNTNKVLAASGHINITKRKEHRYRLKPYCVRYRRHGKDHCIGYFATVDEAIAVRDERLKANDGEFFAKGGVPLPESI